MHSVTQTSPGERLAHSVVFASASAVGIGAFQSLVGANIEQILISSGVDFGQTLATSFVNGTFYNVIKKHLSLKTRFSEKDVIIYSIFIVGILGVGAPKYLIHTLAGTHDPEMIALIYTIGNIAVMWLYEKHILQKKDQKVVTKVGLS